MRGEGSSRRSVNKVLQVLWEVQGALESLWGLRDALWYIPGTYDNVLTSLDSSPVNHVGCSLAGQQRHEPPNEDTRAYTHDGRGIFINANKLFSCRHLSSKREAQTHS